MARTARTTTRKKPAPKGKTPSLEIDVRVPPRMVRRKKDGLVTAWSGLLRKRHYEFECFYRPGSDDALKHEIAKRQYAAKRALEGGDVTAGANAMNMAGFLGGADMDDEDVLDVEDVSGQDADNEMLEALDGNGGEGR